MKLYYQICLGVLLLLNPSTARLYRRDAYVARRYGDSSVAASGSWDSYQGIESYGWNNRVNPVDEACNICNSFSSSPGMQGYGRPQYGSHHHRENHEKNTYNRPDNYRGNGYDNLSPQWNQRYRPRDKHRPWSSEDEPEWTKVTSSYNGGWSRPNTALDRKDSYKPGMYPVKVSTNADKGYWDSHPPREIPWEGDQSNDTRYPGNKNSGYGGSSSNSGGGEPYQPSAGGYTNDFKPWDQTTKGVSGWDGNGKGIYVASSTSSSGGSSYASGWSGDSQKTSTTTRRPNYSITIEEKPARDQSGYNRPSSSNYIPSGYGDKPASGHISGPDQWDRPTSSARPIPVTGYGSTTSSGDTTSWDRPTTTRPSSSYDRPSNSWSRPSNPSSWDRPTSHDRPSNYGKPSISHDKPSSSWSKPVDSWDRPVGPHRESSGYGSSGPSIDSAPLGPDNNYIPPGPAYHGTVTTLSPQPSYHEEHPRFPGSNANRRPGYETPIPSGSGYDVKRPCSRGGCGSYDRPMMSFGGNGRPSGNRYGNSESNYGQSGSGNSNYNGYGSSHAYGGSSGAHGGYRGGSGNNQNDNRDSWGSGGYNSNRGSQNSDSWNSGGYNSNRGSQNSDSWNNGGYNSNRGSQNSDSWNSGGYNSNRGSQNSDSWNSGGYNSNRGGSSGWMNLNSNRGGGYNSGSSSGSHRGSGYGYGGSGNRGGYGDNSSGFGSSSHRYNSDGYGGSNHNDNNYGSGGHQNRGQMHGSNRFNHGGSGYGNNGDDSNSGYGSNSDSDRYHGRPSYGSHMSGGYDYPRPSYMSTSSMRPHEFDRAGHDDADYSTPTYRPDYPSSTGSLDSYSSSSHGPNFDGYGSNTDSSFQPYDQSSSRPFLDYDRDGSLYPSDRYDYSDGPPLQHKHTGLYKVPFYNGHSGVGASTDFGFPTNITSNERDTTTTTTTTVLTESTTPVSPAN